jgi:L-iditol 2-dehydrogenase
MLAAILNKPNEIILNEVLLPEPKSGEVRIKLQKVGICGSDVHLFAGHRLLDKPTIIGHEGFGVIDKIGPEVMDRELGESVVIEPNYPCKKCKYCASGRGNICINKRVLGINESGAFAEYICVPSDFAWKVPSSISTLDAVCIEPMAVAYSALFTSKAQSGDVIAIIGLGAIGLLLTHLATKLGYKVLVSELNEQKRALAEQMGAISVVVSGTFEEQSQKLESIWLEMDVVAVFECAGSDFTASLSTAAAPRGSEIVLVGLSEKNASFRPLKIAREGISILPSIIYNHPFDFKRVIQLIESKIIQPGFIVSNTTTLSDLAKALELAALGNESKIVLEL